MSAVFEHNKREVGRAQAVLEQTGRQRDLMATASTNIKHVPEPHAHYSLKPKRQTLHAKCETPNANP